MLDHPVNMLARAAGTVSRGLGRGGGTSLPGKLLTRWRPDALHGMRDRLTDGALVLSATNGKTTTARLIVACARGDGRSLVTNPSGANLLSGVATALLGADRRPAGKVLGLFEVDEAALPGVVAQLEPRVILLMNLFRDQLDRYGELERIAERWQEMLAAVPAGTRVVLNADDPGVAALGADLGDVTYFGIADTSVALAGLPHAADSGRCRACGTPLAYEAVLLGHLGHWSCPGCGRRRPEPQVAATAVRLKGLEHIGLEVRTPAGTVAVASLALPGVHNAYNATAAVAAATALGIAPQVIAPALATTRAAFGRSERVRVGERDVVLLLVKNPAGANEIVRTLLLDPEPLDLVAILNDRTADGRDVSWIWDVDYEPLIPSIRSLVVAGDRAHDLALRFRYGGLDGERMQVVSAPADALDRALAHLPAGRPLYVLPTYTAMLGLREVLVERGSAEAFWHEA